MRRALLLVVGVAVLALLAPGRVTLAGWTDPTPPATTSTLIAVELQAPAVTCNTVTVTEVLGVPVLTKAVLTWSAFTTPETNVTLAYDAGIVGTALALINATVNGLQRSVEITSSLLSSLLGGQKTVRVTGRMPLTSWTTSTDVAINYAPAGLGVSCA